MLFTLQFFQVLFFQREVILQRYDATYWKDRVEHSRYVLPLSDRGIGDDAFYAYGGYRVLLGEDPTKLVYDKPALGISLIGAFVHLYNGPLSGLFFGIGCMLLTYFITYTITKKKFFGILTSAFLLFDPLFFQNMGTSLLDLPQLFFLLLSMYLLTLLNKKHILLLLFLSGLSLGIFAQIKIPVVYPFVAIMMLAWIFKKYGKLHAITFLLGNILSALLGYLPYFIHGYSVIDYVKIQKYIISFYTSSDLPLHPHAMWQYLFTGSFPGIADGIPSKVAEWTRIYPLAVITSIYFSIVVLLLKKETYFYKMFAVIICVSLIIFTFIPSFPRYLIVILPFMYFFMVKTIFLLGRKWSSLLIIILFIVSFSNTFFYFHRSPSDFLSYFYKNISHQYFQDIYQEQLAFATKSQYKKDEFQKYGQSVFVDAKIKDIQIKETPYKYSPFDTQVSVPVEITYKTEYLGEFTEKKNIEVIKEHDRWKVQWEWNYLLNEYTVDSNIESMREVGKRGKLLDKEGDILAEDRTGYLISFNPSLMKGEQEVEMLKLLSELSTVDEPNLQNAYLQNALNNTYVPLITTQRELTDNELATLKSYKGIQLQEYPARFIYEGDPRGLQNTFYNERFTRIYSSYNYHGVTDYPGPELTYDKKLSGYDGGSLVIKDRSGKILRTVIQKEKKDGEDVILP